MRLMPAQFVRPFVKVEQERLRGCEGIAEAADPRTFGFALRLSAIAAHQDGPFH
jgi:AMMECR1 domain-containing protein